jgi:DNA-binding CsgD family transcriptional regulator
MLTLTPREREVCERLILGRSNREIATELGMAVRTVKGRLSLSFLRNGLAGNTRGKRVVLAMLYDREKQEADAC